MKDVIRITTYVVQYGYIDNTYWDDGNRSTSSKKKFREFKPAFEFYSRLIQHGTVQECSRVSGKTSSFRVSPNDVMFYRKIIGQLTKRQREAVHNMEAAHEKREARRKSTK